MTKEAKLASGLDAQIDQLLDQVVRRIEKERRSAGYAGSDPEAGLTSTEQLLVDAMLGRIKLKDLAEAVR